MKKSRGSKSWSGSFKQRKYSKCGLFFQHDRNQRRGSHEERNYSVPFLYFLLILYCLIHSVANRLKFSLPQAPLSWSYLSVEALISGETCWESWPVVVPLSFKKTRSIITDSSETVPGQLGEITKEGQAQPPEQPPSWFHCGILWRTIHHSSESVCCYLLPWEVSRITIQPLKLFLKILTWSVEIFDLLEFHYLCGILDIVTLIIFTEVLI